MMSLSLLEYITRVFASKETLETARLSKKAFTRKRSIPFTNALHFMLDMRTTTLQTRLNEFFKHNGGENLLVSKHFPNYAQISTIRRLKVPWGGW